MTAYADFITSKLTGSTDAGFEAETSDSLYPFQREITEWALRKGRAAIFADCGMGKTPMQLVWAQRVHEHTEGNVLILAPLAVGAQTAREGDKFNVDVTQCREAPDVRAGVNVTNYERLHRFTGLPWSAVVLDESSILKAFDGKTRTWLTEWAQAIPYRLCCTATPSPNDYEELGGHSEFLGLLRRRVMLAEFFVNDGLEAAHWRLKGHAGGMFWKWIASWSRALRSPSDLGYDDGGFALPPLEVETISVDADAVSEDRLFAVPVATMLERRQARRESIPQRVSVAASIVQTHWDKLAPTTSPTLPGTSAHENSKTNTISTEHDPRAWVIWCDLNDEQRALEQAFGDNAFSIYGTLSIEEKEERMLGWLAGERPILISKPSICGWGINMQRCSNVLFVGLSDSYEQYYQAVRRCWRFGQTKPVRVVIVASNREHAVLENVRRKERQAQAMFADIVEAMRD